MHHSIYRIARIIGFKAGIDEGRVFCDIPLGNYLELICQINMNGPPHTAHFRNNEFESSGNNMARYIKLV